VVTSHALTNLPNNGLRGIISLKNMFGFIRLKLQPHFFLTLPLFDCTSKRSSRLSITSRTHIRILPSLLFSVNLFQTALGVASKKLTLRGTRRTHSSCWVCCCVKPFSHERPDVNATTKTINGLPTETMRNFECWQRQVVCFPGLFLSFISVTRCCQGNPTDPVALECQSPLPLCRC